MTPSWIVQGTYDLSWLRRGWLLCLQDDKRACSPARSAEHHINLTGPTAGTADSSSTTMSCAAFCAMARSKDEAIIIRGGG